MTKEIDIVLLNLTTDVKFRVDEPVNHGGYSDIFRGEYSPPSENKQQVAIKALRVHGPSEAETKERILKHFYREVLLWKRLQHRNIAPSLGYLLPPNKPLALVSPWYPFGNIIKYLKQSPDANRNLLALDVANGLDYLHTFPVAHGDLKGENVLVNEHGNASLCDFGMSQFLDEAARITGYTTTNAYLGGTDRFMCPELLEDEPKSIATDMWAFGCLLMQILTDEIPYKRINRKHAILSAIGRGEQPSSIQHDTISTSLRDYILRCWKADPESRPQASECRVLLQPSDLDLLPIADIEEITEASSLGSVTAASSTPAPEPGWAEEDPLGPEPLKPGDNGFEYSDPAALSCLLCVRQFKTLNQLRRHNTESEMHKSNLKHQTKCKTTKRKVATARKAFEAKARGSNVIKDDRRSRACRRCKRLKMKCIFENDEVSSCRKCQDAGHECEIDGLKRERNILFNSGLME